MAPRSAAAVLLVLALGLGGCFVMDELDRAGRGAERFSRTSKDGAEGAPAPAAARRGPSLVDRLGERVADLRDWLEEALERRGPEDDIVRCQLGREMRFTTRGDCRALGGRVPRS